MNFIKFRILAFSHEYSRKSLFLCTYTIHKQPVSYSYVIKQTTHRILWATVHWYFTCSEIHINSCVSQHTAIPTEKNAKSLWTSVISRGCHKVADCLQILQRAVAVAVRFSCISRAAADAAHEWCGTREMYNDDKDKTYRSVSSWSARLRSSATPRSRRVDKNFCARRSIYRTRNSIEFEADQ